MKEKKLFGYIYTDKEWMKVILYLCIGGTAAIVEWILFYVLFYSFTVGHIFLLQTPRVLIATAVAFGLATLYHYWLGNIFVFEQGSRHARTTEISLIFLVSTIGLGWNLLLMWFFTSPIWLGITPFYAKVLASAIVTVWNYMSRKVWIFK